MFLQESFKNLPIKEGVKPQSQAAEDGKGPRKGGNQAQSSLKQTGNERGMKMFYYIYIIFIFVQLRKRIRLLDMRV